MRAKNREINIFNIALLDVLTGALGAFLFLMLSLFPYYRPPGETGGLPGDSRQESEDLRKQLDEKQAELDLKDKELEEAKKGIVNLLVLSEWTTLGQDIDVYVRTPSGSWTGPKDVQSPALSITAINQTKEDPKAARATENNVSSNWFYDFEKGRYTILARIYDRKGIATDPVVNGWFLGQFSYGSLTYSTISPIVLRQEKKFYVWAVIDVTDNSWTAYSFNQLPAADQEAMIKEFGSQTDPPANGNQPIDQSQETPTAAPTAAPTPRPASESSGPLDRLRKLLSRSEGQSSSSGADPR